MTSNQPAAPQEDPDIGTPLRTKFYRSLRLLFVFVLLFTGYWIWKMNERASALTNYEKYGGTIEYEQSYPKWLTTLRLESWVNEKAFRRITALNYNSDADLNRLDASFNLSQVTRLTPDNQEKCTPEGIMPLSRFPSLKGLTLTGNFINNELLTQAVELEQLEGLGFNNGTVTNEMLTTIARLPHLKRLFISNCQFEENAFQFVKQITQIESLALDRSPIHDPHLSGISNLQSLSQLFINDLDISRQGLEEISNLPFLGDLTLPGTVITADKRQALRNFKGMHNLFFKQLDITDEGLAYLLADDSLASTRFSVPLNLNNSQITDKSALLLSKLASVDRLKIANTFLTPNGYKTLLEKNQIRDLEVGGEHFNEKVLAIIAQSSAISSLSLTDTTLTPGAFGTLATTPYLFELKLNNCPLSTKLIDELNSFDQLNTLQLEKTRLTRSEFKALQRLKKLSRLFLKNCSYEPEALKEFQNSELPFKLYILHDK